MVPRVVLVAVVVSEVQDLVAADLEVLLEGESNKRPFNTILLVTKRKKLFRISIFT